MPMGRVVVRQARRSDSATFLKLLAELAKFEKLPLPSGSAMQRIVKDIFDRRTLHLLVADRDGELVGYALYFFSYSSFLARPTLYLEDLFVLGSERGAKVGSLLFAKCIDVARARECGRMEWSVLNWNRRAITFYEKLGARRLEEWSTFRLESKEFNGVPARLGVDQRDTDESAP